MPPKKSTCGNPLFLSWMEELRDAAREKNMKSAESYSKACRSLLACPVTYTRPRELVVLAHIGEKTVGILEKKWKVYCEENGIVPSPAKSKTKDKGKSRALASEDETVLSDTENSVDPSTTNGKPKKRKTSQPKVYIPPQGSGPYGILLALILAIDQPAINTQIFLTKSEIVRVGQQYCDSPYDHSEKGNYHTAWSGMKTLASKGYVYITGNPQKHCLTEEGYNVAVNIRNLRPEFADMEKHPFLHTPAIGGSSAQMIAAPRPPMQPAKVVPMASGASSSRTSPEKIGASNRPDRFQFWYIDSTGCRTLSLSSGMIRLDPVEFVNLRKIEFRASQRDHAFVSQLRLVDKESMAQQRDSSGSSTLFGFITEEGAPPTCSKFDSDGTRSVSEGSRRRSGESTTAADTEEPSARKHPTAVIPPFPMEDLLPQKRIYDRSSFTRTQSAPSGTTIPASPIRSLAADAALRRASGLPTKTQSAVIDLVAPSRTSRAAPRLSSHMPSPIPSILNDGASISPAPTDDDSSTNGVVPTFGPSDAIVFPSGSYEIILVVDTREVESRSNRDKIAESLAAKGVKVETRALRLGDMCWVARRTEGGLGGEEDECILDYVAERKRLDDLCSSIRDGRYTEQCFRLANSCINHVYYIVEDWQVAQKMEYHGLQIMTAKSQIQVHNRFFLKETHKLSETIDFLATMTKVIKSIHQGKSLHVIPTKYLSRSSYAPLQNQLRLKYPSTTYHISFQAYQDINDKSASVTLKQKFARMLLCVKGMSAERVSAVLDEWDTPRSLWESMKEHEKEWQKRDEMELELGSRLGAGVEAKGKKRKRGKEMMFADKVKGEGRRKIGDALSKELWRSFMGDEAEEEVT